MMNKVLIIFSLLFFNGIGLHAFQIDNVFLGVDLNQNQVRDDVEDMIDEWYPDPNMQVILRNGARAFLQAMLASETIDNRDNEDASEMFARFNWCLNLFSTDEIDLPTIKLLVVNTEARRKAYREYDRSRHGTIQGVVEVDRSECIIPNN